MSTHRRASLPGADELFRSTTRPGEEAPPADESTPSRSEHLLADLVAFAADGDDVPGDLPVELGSLLTWLSGGLSAKHIVAIEAPDAVGWLLRGLAPAGVLTSIISQEDDHARARSAIDRLGGTDHARAILGTPTDVLPRLSDESYDVVVWRGPTERPREARDHALRLLRPDGLIAVLDIRADDRLVRELIDDTRVVVTVLSLGDGLALARRR